MTFRWAVLSLLLRVVSTGVFVVSRNVGAVRSNLEGGVAGYNVYDNRKTSSTLLEGRRDASRFLAQWL
jgi:hypothetical protein